MGTVNYIKGLYGPVRVRYPLGFSPTLPEGYGTSGGHAPASTCVIMGSGISDTYPETSSLASGKFLEYHLKTTNTGSGEVYGDYMSLQSAGTGTGYVYTKGALAKSVAGGYVAELGACYYKSQLTAGTVTGQSYVGFFEYIVDTAVANMPSGGVLQLVDIVSGALNAVHGYICLRTYGTYPFSNLFNIMDHTSGSGKLFYGCTLKNRIGTTAYYIPLSTVENTLTFSGIVSITNTTDASSLTAGALVVAGGIACAKQLYLGDDIDMSVSGTGVYDITLKTNVADALSITDGTDIIVFKTSATRMVTITPALTVTGAIINDDATDTTSGTTGAIQTDGGIGIAKALYVGTTTTSAGALSIGADAAGADATFYGAVTAYKAWWDANGDTNGAWYFGANTKGVQVNLYGDVTGCGVFWDPTTDTNGTLSIGASGGSKGNDVFMYGATNGAYLQWNQNANELLLVGAATALDVAGTEASTTTTTGAITTAGGLGVVGAAWIGGGINIDTCTTGVSVAANIVIPNLVNVGTVANPLHWDGVAPNILIYQENTDTTPGSITANKFSLSAAQSAAVTSGRLECFRSEVKSYSTNAVTADMRALVGQVEFSGDMTYIGSSGNDFAGAYGVIASIWSASNVTANSGNTGHMYPLGIFFGLETGTSLSGEDAYVYIYNYGKVCPQAVIKLYNASTPEAPTYLLDHQGAVLGSASGPVYTGDVNPTGSTGDNTLGADGHIKILVGATPYYIPIFGTLV